MLLVPKAKSAAKSDPIGTLCVYKEPLQEACLLAGTDARSRMEWQSTNADFCGVQWGHWANGMCFKKLAKGSVGLMMIQKPPPKARTPADAMPRTEKKDHLLQSIKARKAARDRAEMRKAMQKNKTAPDATKDITDAKGVEPQLYGAQLGTTVKKKKKQKDTRSYEDNRHYSSNS